MEEKRPNPQQLLEAVTKMEAERLRGKLRVFIGMAPGVGKTYAMLKAAREELKRGIRVMVGVVETHGRKETQELLPGLEVISRRKFLYKGTEVLEMDLDAILAQAPNLVLVDEMAHTNAPGSRHAKRYQDIEELLASGIDVFSTVNIQHIESRKDAVAQITGIAVKETVPDSALDGADQIIVIDLSPAELLYRLKEGKVYLGERAQWAAENFFKEERLTALRELALRFTADKVDQDLQTQMTIKGIKGPWTTQERLLVAISHSPYSGRLIRATRRMADALESPWIALNVETAKTLSAQDLEMLQKNLALAGELGAEVITVADVNLLQAIQQIANDKKVTQVVMGRPDRRVFRDLFSGGTVLDQLVRATSHVDVHVIRTERPTRHAAISFHWLKFKTGFFPYYFTSWFLAGVSGICYGLLPLLGYRALGGIFLLFILVVSGVTTQGPIFFAALVSAFIWNFFFIPPRFTLVVGAWEDRMMLLSFFVTAIVGGLLTSRIRRQEEILRGREQRAQNLYELSKGLSEGRELNQIVAILTSTIEKQFGGQAIALLEDERGHLENLHDHDVSPKDLAVARWVFEHGKSAGWSTQTLSASSCLCLALKGNSGVVGVLIFHPLSRQKFLNREQTTFLDSVLTQAAVAIERYQFSAQAEASKVYEVSERLHQTLLNSISHELRTPITSLVGISSALKDPKTFADENVRASLISDLIQESQRLNRSVENLLDISRLENGFLQLKKEWFEIGDLIRETEKNLSGELKGRVVTVQGDESVVLEGDFRLLEHAFANILINGIRHSPPQSPLAVTIVPQGSFLRILIEDHGKGLQPGTEGLLFEKFFRANNSATGGLGLGLSIVKSVIELHGGKVQARNRDDGPGSIFMCDLPIHPVPEALRETLR